MASKNLPSLLKRLESVDNAMEASDDVLGRTFEVCTALVDIIEKCDLPSNETQFQDAVSKCMDALEKCTHMVNELGLFSTNEAIEEIQTSSIKYLMLPAMLGFSQLSRQSKGYSERYKSLEIAEVYFKDFLFRCKNYELSKPELINKYEKELLEEEDDENTLRLSIMNLNVRESKIQQYKLKKELKARENELKPALEREDADEQIREYYFVVLKRWMLTAIEELYHIKSEKALLKNMIGRGESAEPIPPLKNEIKPLKPIIITKNEIQKKVFGLGYPSLPVMTIDDFYRQRFEKMVKEHKNTSEKSLQDMAVTGSALSKEEEDIQKEVLLDKDDPETLEKDRAWDDWKDDNPRGSGNRKNKG